MAICASCRKRIARDSDGVWRATDYADVNGYCTASTDDERHKPELTGEGKEGA